MPALDARRAAKLFFAYLIGQLGGFIAAALCVVAYYAATVGFRAPGATRETLQMATVLGGIFGILIGGRVVRWRLVRGLDAAERERILAECGWVAKAHSTYALAAIAGLALAAVYLGLAMWFPESAGNPGVLGQVADSGGTGALLWAFLAVGIAPPVEEFVFRGVLYSGLAKAWPPIIAGAVTTAVFLVMHLAEAWGNWTALLAITTMGVVALLVRVRTGSFVPGIFLHAAYNALVAVAVVGFPQ